MRAAQAGHALIDYALAFPAALVEWHSGGNNLIILGAADEAALETLGVQLEEQGHQLIRIHEPDLGGQLTAIAVDGSARRALRDLPLV